MKKERKNLKSIRIEKETPNINKGGGFEIIKEIFQKINGWVYSNFNTNLII